MHAAPMLPRDASLAQGTVACDANKQSPRGQT